MTLSISQIRPLIQLARLAELVYAIDHWKEAHLNHTAPLGVRYFPVPQLL